MGCRGFGALHPWAIHGRFNTCHSIGNRHGFICSHQSVTVVDMAKCLHYCFSAQRSFPESITGQLYLRGSQHHQQYMEQCGKLAELKRLGIIVTVSER